MEKPTPNTWAHGTDGKLVSHGLYFSDKTRDWKNGKIVKMYDLSFRVNLVYKPKTIWFWIKKVMNKVMNKA